VRVYSLLASTIFCVVAAQLWIALTYEVSCRMSGLLVWPRAALKISASKMLFGFSKFRVLIRPTIMSRDSCFDTFC